MPKSWNGSLIVFAHGGPSLEPAKADSSKGDLQKYAVEVERGFAWVASSYRKEGYGVAMAGAIPTMRGSSSSRGWASRDTRFCMGASYGGLVAAKLIETQARITTARS
jgi:dipeptidyl aminopeptidase/acylaminoacyl peptidase